MPTHPDARRKIMNAVAKGDALTFPTTWWLGIHITTLSTATLPSTGNEVPRAGGYARAAVTTAMLTSATTASSTVVLSTRVNFPDPLTDWTTNAKALAWYDSSVTSGAGASTCWFFGDMQTSVQITAGNTPFLSSGTTLGASLGLN